MVTSEAVGRRRVRGLGSLVAVLYRWAWVILGILATLATVLGTWAFYQLPTPGGEPATFSDAFYYALQLFVLQSGAVAGPTGWQLNVARFLAAVVGGGTLLGALVMISYDKFKLGFLRIFGRNHVIVCGLGRKGAALVSDLRERSERVVVVENNPDNPALEHCRELGATVLIGSSTNRLVLGSARVAHAKALVSVIGDDGANVETAVLARELNKKRTSGKLRCVIHVVDRGLNEMLRQTEMANREDDPFELVFFNAYETCAQTMLRDMLLSGVSRTVKHPPHLLILGLGQLGETLAVRAAREWKKVAGGGKLRITVFDRSAKAKQEPFALLYPEVGDAADVSFHELDVRQPQFTKGTSLHQIEGWQELTAAYVCLGNDTLGVYAGLALVEMLKPRCVPIIVRMSERAGLATALRVHKTDPGFVDGLQAVGLVELTCKAELVLGDTEAAAPGAGRG